MLWDRMIRAARLEAGLYKEVEQDTSATSQALLVVLIVAVLSGIGGLILAATIPFLGLGGGIRGLITGIITSLIAWAVWSFVTYWIGTTLFKGTATYGELLRCLGFAYTPSALGFFVFIPALGPLIAFIGSIWALVAMIIAIREALNFTTGNAVITAVIGFVVMLIVTAILGALGLAGGPMGVGRIGM